MKRERIYLLVTVSVRHDGTPADCREAIAAAKENVMAVRESNRAEPKRVTLSRRPLRN